MPKRTMFVAMALATAAVALAIAAGAFASSSPEASTGAASNVGDSSATLSASVNPAGQQTTYAFEYGTSAKNYSSQTPVQSAGAGAQKVTVTAQVASLRPGTTYHYRVIATSAAGTATGSDATFKTTGIAPPETPGAPASTGAPSTVGIESVTLNGTINTTAVPAGETQSYYFQLGPSLPYTLQSAVQQIKGASGIVPVKAFVSGLASAQVFHYRLVTVTEAGKVTAGPDETFFTLPRERQVPLVVEASATPAFQRRIPDRVTVSGRMVPPKGISNFIACRGYFDITFRVGQVAVQSLRAGIHKDCTFRLPVVFHNRRRLHGGQVSVHVLFAGNRFLHRREAPVRTIQVG
jgi:hypothetical protein